MANGRVLAFVGTLNRPVEYFPAARGRGIGVFAYDEATGGFTPLHEVGVQDNPGYLILNDAGDTLYAASEVGSWHEGIVTAYRIDRATGALTYINTQPTRGSITCHASLAAGGRWLLVANYRVGPDGLRPPQAVTVFPVERDGGIGPAVASVAHQGSGPNAARQDGPHPHCAVPTPDGSHVIVADLGTDEIIAYRLDAGTGALARAHTVAAPPGAGPRSCAFHPDGRTLYVTFELGSAVAVLGWDAAGHLALRQVVPTLPAGWSGESTCSDLAISPDGRFLYVANRGHDSIAAFAISAADGVLTALHHVSTQGHTPRHITLDLAGRFLLIANQDSDAVVVLPRDASSGHLSAAATHLPIGTPMCVRLLRTT